ncbi:MAG TPA: hypothetical protein VEL77_15235 [Rugosimonospora sp.]|nr:hypothetical protein [Rugosimonospora sp.]
MHFGAVIPTVDAYYVDVLDGSNSNTGAYNQPFQTVAHLVSVDTGANKSRWRFAVSSAAHPATQRQWREAVTVPRNNMTIDAWDPMGSGLKYLLDASDAVAATSWTATDGQANVYQAAVVLDPSVSSGGGFVTSYENGTVAVRAASLVACQSTAGSYYPSADLGTITLYVHLTGDADPTAKADGWIEVSTRPFGITTRSVTGVTISGAWTRRNLHTDGSTVLGSYCTLAHSLVTQGSKHSCYVKKNAALTHVELLDGYWGTVGGPSPLVLNDTWGAGDSISLSNVYSHFTVMPTAGDAMLAHGTGNLGNLSIVDSQFMGPAGIVFSQVANAYLQNVTVTATTPGIQMSSELGGSAVTIGDSSIALSSGASRGIDIQADAFEASPQSLILTVNNGSVTVSGSGSNAIFNGAVNNATLNLIGITLAGESGVVQTRSGVTLNASGLNLSGVTSKYYHFGSAFTAVSDNNDFGTGAAAFTVNGVTKTYAQWKALGYDAHSTP